MPDVDPEESTVNYLKRLRQADESASARTFPQPDVFPPADHQPELSPTITEQRRHPRYKCAGSAEPRKEGTTVRTWGSFTDVSQSGCYVEMQGTFPPETTMELLLELRQIRVKAKAVVRVTYPFLGMGLAFTEISEDDRAMLGKLLECVAGNSSRETGWLQAPGSGVAQEIPAIHDQRAVVEALLKHFDRAESLIREGFWSLLRTSISESR